MGIMTYIFIGVGFLFFLGILAAVYAFVFGGRKKKFAFILYNNDGTVNRVLQPHLWIDPENKSNKKFKFQEFSCELDYQAPTMSLNGVLYRECYLNDIGEVSYIKKKIDKEAYLKISVSPEEKAISLARFKENSKRNQNSMDKLQAFLLIGFFFMILIVVGATIYIAITTTNTVSAVKEIVDIQQQNMANGVKISEAQTYTTDRLSEIVVILTNKDFNITRRLE